MKKTKMILMLSAVSFLVACGGMSKEELIELNQMKQRLDAVESTSNDNTLKLESAVSKQSNLEEKLNGL